MKKPTYKGKELLPLSVIDAARDGDSQAPCSGGRVHEAPIGDQAHSFHCQHELTSPV